MEDSELINHNEKVERKIYITSSLNQGCVFIVIKDAHHRT